jgi:hypothetical protein
MPGTMPAGRRAASLQVRRAHERGSDRTRCASCGPSASWPPAPARPASTRRRIIPGTPACRQASAHVFPKSVTRRPRKRLGPHDPAPRRARPWDRSGWPRSFSVVPALGEDRGLTRSPTARPRENDAESLLPDGARERGHTPTNHSSVSRERGRRRSSPTRPDTASPGDSDTSAALRRSGNA